MRQLGNLAEDQVIDFFFNTTKFSDGTNITLAGTPSLEVYKANGTTQSTAGLTLDVDFDGKTGLHHVRIDTSADAFFATANDYAVVIAAGTVDGVSVVGRVLAEFSIQNRYIPDVASAETNILDRIDYRTATSHFRPDLMSVSGWDSASMVVTTTITDAVFSIKAFPADNPSTDSEFGTVTAGVWTAATPPYVGTDKDIFYVWFQGATAGGTITIDGMVFTIPAASAGFNATFGSDRKTLCRWEGGARVAPVSSPTVTEIGDHLVTRLPGSRRIS